MIDSPQVDNPNRPDVTPRGINFSPLPNMDKPGKRNGATPLNLEQMEELQQQKSPGDELIMKALQKSIEDQKQKKEEPFPELMEKKIDPKKSVPIDTQKNNSVIQQGFLMPFVNWFNGLFNGAKDAVIRVIMKQPTPSRGTA